MTSAAGPGLSHRQRVWGVLALLLLMGGGVRACHVDSPGVVPDRQFRSKLITRALYLESQDDVPEWRKHVAATSSRRQEPLEPPITERVVASVYELVGGERPAFAKVVISVFWLLGAIPLFFIVYRVGSLLGAACATAYYLLVPSGVLMSLSLLPEPLMLTGMLYSLWAITHYWDAPSTRRLAVAAVVSAVAILIKPLVVFLIFGAFTAFAVYHSSITRFIDRRFVTFSVLSMLPNVMYYGRGIFVEDYLRWKVDVSFLPHLFFSKAFWTGWLTVGSHEAGVAVLLVSLVGFPLIARGRGRTLLIGLWVGYLGFCFTFNYFVYFVDYYHAQLLVVVAVSMGLIVPLAWERLRPVLRPWYTWTPVGAAVIVAAVAQSQAVARGGVTPRFVGDELAAEIGEIVEHSDRVAYVASVYGLPLEYAGELAGEHWPRPLEAWPLSRSGDAPRTIGERLDRLGFVPEYFVITSFDEYRRHHDDLRTFLETRCRLIVEHAQYLIYEIPPEALALPLPDGVHLASEGIRDRAADRSRG